MNQPRPSFLVRTSSRLTPEKRVHKSKPYAKLRKVPSPITLARLIAANPRSLSFLEGRETRLPKPVRLPSMTAARHTLAPESTSARLVFAVTADLIVIPMGICVQGFARLRVLGFGPECF